MRLAAKQLSIFLLCAVFLLCFYRAATQSFTIDESFTFLHYVNVSFSQAIAEYSANNHVLQSLLMRVFRRLLGRSELNAVTHTDRMCTLLNGRLWHYLGFNLNGWLRLLALAVMTLNPLVLDLLSPPEGMRWRLAFLGGRCTWRGQICWYRSLAGYGSRAYAPGLP